MLGDWAAMTNVLQRKSRRMSLHGGGPKASRSLRRVDVRDRELGLARPRQAGSSAAMHHERTVEEQRTIVLAHAIAQAVSPSTATQAQGAKRTHPARYEARYEFSSSRARELVDAAMAAADRTARKQQADAVSKAKTDMHDAKRAENASRKEASAAADAVAIAAKAKAEAKAVHSRLVKAYKAAVEEEEMARSRAEYEEGLLSIVERSASSAAWREACGIAADAPTQRPATTVGVAPDGDGEGGGSSGRQAGWGWRQRLEEARSRAVAARTKATARAKDAKAKQALCETAEAELGLLSQRAATAQARAEGARTSLAFAAKRRASSAERSMATSIATSMAAGCAAHGATMHSAQQQQQPRLPYAPARRRSSSSSPRLSCSPASVGSAAPPPRAPPPPSVPTPMVHAKSNTVRAGRSSGGSSHDRRSRSGLIGHAAIECNVKGLVQASSVRGKISWRDAEVQVLVGRREQRRAEIYALNRVLKEALSGSQSNEP